MHTQHRLTTEDNYIGPGVEEMWRHPKISSIRQLHEEKGVGKHEGLGNTRLHCHRNANRRTGTCARTRVQGMGMQIWTQGGEGQQGLQDAFRHLLNAMAGIHQL